MLHAIFEPDPEFLERVGNSVMLVAGEEGELFVARECFVRNEDGEVPIYEMNADFEENFLEVREIIVPCRTQAYAPVLSMHSYEILNAHGDTDPENAQWTTLALQHMYAHMRVRPSKDRCGWFLFFVKSPKGVVWCIHTAWDRGKEMWKIHAYRIFGKEHAWSNHNQLIAPVHMANATP